MQGLMDYELRAGLLENAVSDEGVFSEIATDMREHSQLFACGRGSSKDSVYGAYAHDLALLQKYQAGLEACVQAAVRCSLVTSGERRGQQQRRWQILKTQMPSAGTQILDMSFTSAALPMPKLVAEMKVQFNNGIRMIMEPFMMWLEALVENQFIGVVEWSDLDVCRYHYFRHQFTEQVVAQQLRQVHSFDSTKQLGSRNMVKVMRDQTIRRQQFREQHVHHIVHAKPFALDEYTLRVPTYVAEFIDAVPSFLQSHLRILEGDITKEEVDRRMVANQEFVESKVLSVDKYSPGVPLGHYNLAGWSGDDLKSRTRFYAIQRAVRQQARRRRFAAGAKRMVGHLFTA